MKRIWSTASASGWLPLTGAESSVIRWAAMWEGAPMHKHNFTYFLCEGISNMFSHGFMSFAAIGITVACLLIMGTFTLVAVNADANLKDLEDTNEFLAYVDESYSEADARALQSRLEAVPNVASASYISREEALTAFSKQ